MTFFELYSKWRQTKGMYVKRSTLSSYELVLKNHILPNIGHVEISSIKNDTLQELLLKLLDRLSIKSAKDVMIVVKMILKYAAEMELIPARIYSLKYPTRNMDDCKFVDTYTLEQQKKMTSFILKNPSPRNLGILITLCTGMRIGEICALKWVNVDLENKVIKVKTTVQRVYYPSEGGKWKTEVVFDRPKTIDSNRDIPIQRDLLMILKKFKQTSIDDYFVISGSRNVMEPRTYRNYYIDFISNQVKLDKCLKFHGLRHTFATRLVESGAEVTAVSKIMGHSNVSVTLNLYVHPTTSSKADCINRSLKGFF